VSGSPEAFYGGPFELSRIVASNASQVISETENQPRHSLRESLPNIPMDLDELKREQGGLFRIREGERIWKI